jgi:hypothetical protein
MHVLYCTLGATKFITVIAMNSDTLLCYLSPTCIFNKPASIHSFEPTVKKSLDLLLVVLVGRGGGGGSLVHFLFFVGNDFLPFLMFTIKLSSRGDRQI